MEIATEVMEPILLGQVCEKKSEKRGETASDRVHSSQIFISPE
jgi:hypothetical protein